MIFNINIRFLIVIIFSISTIPTVAQKLVINEIMPANDTTFADENGDFEDWIEIYNAGNKPVSLKDYGISDDADEPFRWVFPDTTIAPGGFLLIWASNKNRALGNEPISFLKKLGMGIDGENIPEPPRPLHTDFKIKSEGEVILLSDPSGKVMDEFEPVNVSDHISYGRFPDGESKKYYFSVPTPGAPNNESYYNHVTE